jgi:hypothetical protein
MISAIFVITICYISYTRSNIKIYIFLKPSSDIDNFIGHVTNHSMTHALWRINILGNLKKKTNSEIIIFTNFEIRVKIRVLCPAFDYLTLNIVGRFLVCLASDRDDWGQKKNKKLSWQLYNPLIYWKTLINNVWWLIYFTTHDDTSSMTHNHQGRYTQMAVMYLWKSKTSGYRQVWTENQSLIMLQLLQANWLICPNLEVRHKMEVVYV